MSISIALSSAPLKFSSFTYSSNHQPPNKVNNWFSAPELINAAEEKYINVNDTITFMIYSLKRPLGTTW